MATAENDSRKEEIIALITAQGDVVKKLKADKEDITEALGALKALKAQYKEEIGEEYLAPGHQGSRKDKKKVAPPTPPAQGANGEPAEKSKKALAKEKKAKEKEEKRLAREAEQKAAAAAKAQAVYAEDSTRFGDYPLLQSQTLTDRHYVSVGDVTGQWDGKEVWIRARVQVSRAVGKGAFLLMRESQHTVQCVVFQGGGKSKSMVKYATDVSRESVVDIRGKVLKAPEPVLSATQSEVEVHIEEIHVISRSAQPLPLSVEDASRSEEEMKEMPGTSQKQRLDYRWIDLRTPANQGIFRIQSGVCELFREFLSKKNFVEIHSPKIIAGASEGGAEVFKCDYFGSPACLAQSPQLYKQMTAACSGFGKVFEIGPVFRAENSNSNRHLCEFTGLDFEMVIEEHYFEVLDTFGKLFVHIFDGLNERFKDEIEAVNQQFPFEPLKYITPSLRITYPEGIKLLQDAGHSDASVLEDLSSENEKALGAIVREKFGTDFFMMDKYPLAVRPFYTMPCPDNPAASNSFDIFIRGEEIVSGAQRIHDVDLLVERAKWWQIPLDDLASYLDAFRHGVEPHGGGGIGMERVVKLFLGLDNIRKTSMFPRDPKRCAP